MGMGRVGEPRDGRTLETLDSRLRGNDGVGARNDGVGARHDGGVRGMTEWVRGMTGWVRGMTGWVRGMTGWVRGMTGWVRRMTVGARYDGVGATKESQMPDRLPLPSIPRFLAALRNDMGGTSPRNPRGHRFRLGGWNAGCVPLPVRLVREPLRQAQDRLTTNGPPLAERPVHDMSGGGWRQHLTGVYGRRQLYGRAR